MQSPEYVLKSVCFCPCLYNYDESLDLNIIWQKSGKYYVISDYLKEYFIFFFQKYDLNWVLYMSSSFWLFGVESRVFSHAEKEKNCLQSWANSQNDNYFHSKWS